MASQAKLLAVLAVIASLAFSACAVSPAAPTPLPSAPTPTPVPPAATPESIAWDYVVLGDSVGGSFASRYAKHIQADLGVEVTMHAWHRGQQGGNLSSEFCQPHPE